MINFKEDILQMLEYIEAVPVSQWGPVQPAVHWQE